MPVLDDSAALPALTVMPWRWEDAFHGTTVTLCWILKEMQVSTESVALDLESYLLFDLNKGYRRVGSYFPTDRKRGIEKKTYLSNIILIFNIQ